MLLSVTITRTGVRWMPKLSWTSRVGSEPAGLSAPSFILARLKMLCQEFYANSCCSLLPASSKYIVPECLGKPCYSLNSKVGDLKKSGAENFRKGLPETRQCGRTCPDQSHGHFASWGARRRAPNGSSTTSESGRIWLRICFMLWRQPVALGHPDMGGNSSAVQDQLRNMQQI